MENTKTTKKTTTKAACKKTTKVTSSTAKTAACAAKKGCGCKKIATGTEASTCKTTSNAKVFPTEYLNSWLQNRYSWNHNDWLGLLSDLSSKGYSYYAETIEGQNIVGNYIETNRWR